MFGSWKFITDFFKKGLNVSQRILLTPLKGKLKLTSYAFSVSCKLSIVVENESPLLCYRAKVSDLLKQMYKDSGRSCSSENFSCSFKDIFFF